MNSKKTKNIKSIDSSKASVPGGGLEGARAIDLNCDLGEGSGNDELIMPYISSANIACGYHAGNEKTIWETIELSGQYKVAIGAHISFFDRKNFGRIELDLPLSQVYDLVIQQLIIMNEIISAFDVKIKHVKPHGALYNMSAKDPNLAKTIATAVKDFDDSLLLFGLAGSHSITQAKALKLKTASEIFADRSYQDDGSLTPRSNPHALIENEEKSLQQVLQMLQKGTVTCLSGNIIPIVAETICIHGDGKNAPAFAKRIYENLKQNNIGIKSF